MKLEDIILQTVTKVIVFIILTFAIYLFFSGHHSPGGGFIGGLVTASALVLLYMAFDVETVNALIPVDFKIVGAVGAIIAVVAGIGAMLAGQPFLAQAFTYVELPLFGRTELATSLIFDVGVYLAVLGAGITSILSIGEDEN